MSSLANSVSTAPIVPESATWNRCENTTVKIPIDGKQDPLVIPAAFTIATETHRKCSGQDHSGVIGLKIVTRSLPRSRKN